MAKKVTIRRQKKFTGSVIKFYVVFNMKGSELREQLEKNKRVLFESTFLTTSDQVFSLKNGEEITIDLLEEKNSFFVMAFTSGGQLFSHRVRVEEWKEEVSYIVEMKMGMLKNEFLIHEV